MRRVQVIEKEEPVLLIVSELHLSPLFDLINLLPLSKTKKTNARSLETRQKNKKTNRTHLPPNPAAVTQTDSQLKNARRRSQVTIRVSDASN
jgi:hypothetical protein